MRMASHAGLYNIAIHDLLSRLASLLPPTSEKRYFVRRHFLRVIYPEYESTCGNVESNTSGKALCRQIAEFFTLLLHV